ncbi:MAG: hypothetical protein JRJ77_09690 [Deltaproteobacteria bacterium]|nr:hypothetical protein [Deltaproteobacteria bacterium]
MTEESCGPYGGGEDLRGNACWVVGFYTPAYCNTFFQKKYVGVEVCFLIFHVNSDS